MNAPTPKNEADRLRTLQLYRILDTAVDKTFDDLARLAGAICETPINLISLVDKDRQWFKSRVGLPDATETPREFAFCAHAILGSDVMVVEDATADDRFKANPLVTGDPKIRFYAGAPLVVGNGSSLGTLCVIDRKPRKLARAQLEALEVLRGAVVTQLELRRAVQDLEALGRLLPICAWCRKVKTHDGAWQDLWDYVNRSAPVTHGMCPACATGAGMTLP